METIQIIGILIAIVCIIYGAMRGVSILVLAPVCTIIVIVTNQMPFFDSLLAGDSYMTGLADFVVNFFAVFALGAILAKYMEASGAAQTIANRILKITGTEKPYPVLVGLFLITAVLTYGGISLFVAIFVLIPLARPLFKRLNLAWNLVPIPITLGFGTFTMTMLPGSPSIQNVVPTAYLDTSLTAAPVLGIVGSAVAIVFSLWFIHFTMKKSLTKGTTYADFEETGTSEKLKEKIPPLGAAVLPLVLLILIILIGSYFEVPQIILIGLTAAIIVSALVFYKYIPDRISVLNEGASGSVMPILLTSSSVAFGVVITLAPGFAFISDFILGIPGDPLISLSIASTIFGGITGSSSGALGIVLQAFGDNYLAMGIHPDVIHRVSAIASSVLTVMPHSGVILTMFALTGLNHKNAFINQFLGMTAANLLALIVVILMATFIY